MFTLRIGVQLAALRQPLKKALQTAAQLGAEAVEIDARHELMPRELSTTGLRQFRKLLDDLNLKVCAVSFTTRRGYDVPDDLDARVGATKETMQMAYQLGASVVINQIGPVPPVPSDETSVAERRRWQTLVEVLTDVGQFGQRCGARLAASTGTEPGACYVPPTATPVPVGSISGYVYRGVNSSPSTPRFSGATVTLGQGSCPSSGYKSTSTNGDGYYIFNQLPAGTYCVTVIKSSLPPASYGWATMYPGGFPSPPGANPYHSVTVGNNENVQNKNFAFLEIIG